MAALAVFVLIAFGLVKGVMAIACTVFGEPKDVSVVEAAPEPEESQEAETQPVEIMTPEEVDANQMAKYGCKIYGSYGYPWNRMSQDWDNIEGFYYHDISTAAKQAGGEFPVIAQIYTYIVCRDAGVDYETVFALIEKESGCVWDAIGDSGESVGLMQINERWHRDRMRKERCTDLMNPYMNIRVGVSYLAELYEVTGNVTDMLTAYNYGLQGARENMWCRGIHDYPYNEEIMQRAAELKAETAAARKQWEERNKERCAKALAQIHRQVERAKNLSNEIYQDLLRAENEHRIAVERSNASVFVLRAAQVPVKPIVPNPWIIFPTGAVLSLCLALVFRNCPCGCGSSRKAPRGKDSRP